MKKFIEIMTSEVVLSVAFVAIVLTLIFWRA